MTPAPRARATLTEDEVAFVYDWTPDDREKRVAFAAELQRILAQRASADAAALAAITALAAAALAERRRGCPTYGLVSAARIQAIVEEARDG